MNKRAKRCGEHGFAVRTYDDDSETGGSQMSVFQFWCAEYGDTRAKMRSWVRVDRGISGNCQNLIFPFLEE